MSGRARRFASRRSPVAAFGCPVSDAFRPAHSALSRTPDASGAAGPFGQGGGDGCRYRGRSSVRFVYPSAPSEALSAPVEESAALQALDIAPIRAGSYFNPRNDLTERKAMMTMPMSSMPMMCTMMPSMSGMMPMGGTMPMGGMMPMMPNMMGMMGMMPNMMGGMMPMMSDMMGMMPNMMMSRMMGGMMPNMMGMMPGMMMPNMMGMMPNMMGMMPNMMMGGMMPNMMGMMPGMMMPNMMGMMPGMKMAA
ncbi:hypothetical protein WMF26_21095 [Sorangium sp. So ce185]|uniref:hypothetical protein n=1 Tax=Sorangium sp. So ce185 TaxID=3133287 RepID=UPI003F5F4EAB